METKSSDNEILVESRKEGGTSSSEIPTNCLRVKLQEMALSQFGISLKTFNIKPLIQQMKLLQLIFHAQYENLASFMEIQ